jgi:hypothetical protein
MVLGGGTCRGMPLGELQSQCPNLRSTGQLPEHIGPLGDVWKARKYEVDIEGATLAFYFVSDVNTNQYSCICSKQTAIIAGREEDNLSTGSYKKLVDRFGPPLTSIRGASGERILV